MKRKKLLDTKVKYISSKNSGFLQGTDWGDFIPILDKVLVNGGDPINVLSIISKEDPDDDRYWISEIQLENVVDDFKELLTVIKIEGCSEDIYNREFRVQKVSNREVVIAFLKEHQEIKPQDVSDASGTTIRIAPLGASKVRGNSEASVYLLGENSDKGLCYLLCKDKYLNEYGSNHAPCVVFGISNEVEGYSYAEGHGVFYAPSTSSASISTDSGSCKVFYSKTSNNNASPIRNGPQASEWEIFGDNCTILMLNKDQESEIILQIYIGALEGPFENTSLYCIPKSSRVERSRFCNSYGDNLETIAKIPETYLSKSSVCTERISGNTSARNNLEEPPGYSDFILYYNKEIYESNLNKYLGSLRGPKFFMAGEKKLFKKFYEISGKWFFTNHGPYHNGRYTTIMIEISDWS